MLTEETSTFRRAGSYFYKNMIIAVFSWILFNTLTSLITKEYDFFDNYYALVFFILIAKYKSSYEVRLKKESWIVKRNGMITANINLSEIEYYKFTHNLVELHTTDNAVFNVKLNKLCTHDSNYITSIIKENFKNITSYIPSNINHESLNTSEPTAHRNTETINRIPESGEPITPTNTSSTRGSLKTNASVTRIDVNAGFKDLIFYSAIIAILLSYVTYSIYLGDIFIPDFPVARHTYTAIVSFFGVCFLLIFLTSRTPIKKSPLKIIIILLCLVLTPHWWRTNISVNNLSHQKGCLVSTESGDIVKHNFKSGEDTIPYIWKIPTEFRYKKEHQSKCFMVTYYKFLGNRYIYSARLTKEKI